MSDAAPKPSPRSDGWMNLLTGMGVENKDHRLSTSYQARTEMPMAQIDALYEQDAIFARVIDTMPDDGTRRWIKVLPKGDDAENAQSLGSDVISWLDELEARTKLCDLWTQGDLYGGALIVVGVDDGLPIDQPLNIDSVKAVKSLTVLTRHDVGVVGYDMNRLSPTYGARSVFTLAGGERIHSSRCFVYTGRVGSTRRLIERQGWGPSKVERVFESLRRYGSIWAYVEAMFKDTTQGVLGIKGLNDLLLAKEDNRILIRLQALAKSASAYRAIVIDQDEEKYERREASFSGIDHPILRAMDDFAAASEMPLSKLFGQAPTGLSTDDQSGMRNYYDLVASRQRRILRAPLERLIEMGMAAGVIPRVEKKNWQLDFEPLEEPNEKSEAETDKLRAETDSARILDNVITPTEARSRLANDPSCPYVLDGEEAPQPEPSAQDQLLLKELANPTKPEAPPVKAPGKGAPVDE